MKVLFVCAPYYKGPVRHLFRVGEIYKALGDVFTSIGAYTAYYVSDSALLPNHQQIIKHEDAMNTIDQFDAIFIWNGSQTPDIVEKARSIGVPICFSELGWMPQNGTFYFDLKGVNYESSLRDWSYAPLKPHEDHDIAVKLDFYHKIFAVKVANDTEAANIKRPFVFVPFQVEGDSQIIKHSPRIKSMQALVDYVCKFITKDDIVFKTHPKHSIEGIKMPDNRCHLISGGSTHSYLPRAKYVVTINSTVGVEALTYYKPVINLGNAFYGGRGLTCEAGSDEDFIKAIAWAEKGEAALGIIASFLTYLFTRQWYSVDLKNKGKILGLFEKVTCG